MFKNLVKYWVQYWIASRNTSCWHHIPDPINAQNICNLYKYCRGIYKVHFSYLEFLKSKSKLLSLTHLKMSWPNSNGALARWHRALHANECRATHICAQSASTPHVSYVWAWMLGPPCGKQERAGHTLVWTSRHPTHAKAPRACVRAGSLPYHVASGLLPCARHMSSWPPCCVAAPIC
jgi:hypothetical protein